VIETQCIMPISEPFEQVVAKLRCEQCGATQDIRVADVNRYIKERTWPTCCNTAMAVFIYPTPPAP